MRVATENLLAAFLLEIRDVTTVQKRFEEQMKAKREAIFAEQSRPAEGEPDKMEDFSTPIADRANFLPEREEAVSESNVEVAEDKTAEQDVRDAGGKCPCRL